ncbi:MAG: hypothetical protein NVSMB25_16430 [Thermoleophilaceae bacterium]
MTRVRTAAVLVLLGLLLSIATAARAAQPIDELVQKVNQFRVANGLKPVRLVPNLARSATRYSRWMMTTGYFGHLPRIRASHHYRTLGEVIELHRGRRPRMSMAFADWVASPPHRAVLLYPTFRFVGGGFTSGNFHGRGATIWCMHFAR